MKLSTVGALSLAAALLVVPAARAITLGVGTVGTDILGDVIPPASLGAGGQANDAQAMVNQLIGMTISTNATVNGSYFDRSSNVFSPLPSATLTGDVVTAFADITLTTTTAEIDLLGISYRYLVAVYDGKESGAEVWDIASVGGGETIIIPRYAYPVDLTTGPLTDGATPLKFQISSWTLLNPTSTSVPDGGATVTLIGLGLLGIIGFRRRFLRR